MELSPDMRFRILRVLEENPGASQRDLALALGVSLGKVNYCLKALIAKGIIKAKNFKNSRQKLAYMYQLTPAGMEEKSRTTLEFLRRKIAEVEKLQSEIDQLRIESQSKSR